MCLIVASGLRFGLGFNGLGLGGFPGCVLDFGILGLFGCSAS